MVLFWKALWACVAVFLSLEMKIGLNVLGGFFFPVDSIPGAVHGLSVLFRIHGCVSGLSRCR